MQYSDKTLMRNALAYGLAAATGQYSPRTRFCEVVLNGQYQGVYLLVEKIKRDKHRVDIQKFHAGATPQQTGFIVKIDKNTGSPSYRWSGLLVHDGNQRSGWRRAAFHCDYPKSDDLSQEMQRYIQDYITEFERRLSEPEARPDSCQWCDSKSGWFDYIDVPSFVDYMIVQEMVRPPSLQPPLLSLCRILSFCYLEPRRSVRLTAICCGLSATGQECRRVQTEHVPP